MLLIEPSSITDSNAVSIFRWRRQACVLHASAEKESARRLAQATLVPPDNFGKKFPYFGCVVPIIF